MSHLDQLQIHEIVETWAAAIRARDLDAVAKHRADDIVMFDVPPPEDGVRGIDEYRAAWPEFFEWIASGATFEIVSMDVTAGSDVAYVVALAHCGHPEERDRKQFLRLTLGLVKRDESWLVQHEHHSFTYVEDRFEGKQAVRDIHEEWFANTERKNLDGIMSHIAGDVVSYEHEAALEYRDLGQVRDMCRSGLEQVEGVVTWTVPDLSVIARDDLAVAWGLNRMTAEMPDGSVEEEWSRGTRVFRRRDGKWVMTHQHVSYPREAPQVGQSPGVV